MTDDWQEVLKRKRKKSRGRTRKPGKARKKRKKLTAKPSSEKSLSDWFGRKGAKGSTGGWIDCNTCREDKNGRKKCKPCGRAEGEKRSEYPECRPTPGACNQKGRGKTWGKGGK